MPSPSTPSKRKAGTPKTPSPSKRMRSADPKVFGHIPGVGVGAWWEKREECSADAVHAPWVAGISGGKNVGTYSIALSGGYEDDEDLGYTFTYTGAGGRDLGGTPEKPKNVGDQWLRTAPQSQDQSFTHRHNAALKTSEETGKPVRVVRGYKLNSVYAPGTGYRYDGLYVVEQSWMERGKEGFKVCRYKFKRLGDQPPLPGTELPEDKPDTRDIDAKSRVAVKTEDEDIQMNDGDEVAKPGAYVSRLSIKQEAEDDNVFLVKPEVDDGDRKTGENAESKPAFDSRSVEQEADDDELLLKPEIRRDQAEVGPESKPALNSGLPVKLEVDEYAALVKPEVDSDQKIEVTAETKATLDGGQLSDGYEAGDNVSLEARSGGGDLKIEVSPEVKLGGSGSSEVKGEGKSGSHVSNVVDHGVRNLETGVKAEPPPADLKGSHDSRVRDEGDERLLEAEIRPAADRGSKPNVRTAIENSPTKVEVTIKVDFDSGDHTGTAVDSMLPQSDSFDAHRAAETMTRWRFGNRIE